MTCNGSGVFFQMVGVVMMMMMGARGRREEKRGEGEEWSRPGRGDRGGGGAGCQGGPLGHEIKRQTQRDTRKINRETGLPGSV